MSSGNAQLDGGRFLADINQRDSKMGALFQRIITAINTLSSNVAASPVGQAAAPPPPDSISVKAAGEMVHVSITHNVPIQRGIQYFTEVSNSPSFSQPIVIDHGASRTSHPFPLPTQDDGGASHTWYFRSYAQYHGSPPSEKTVYGGASNPVAVTLSGSTRLTLLPSAGSGTASPTGFQGGQGLGTFTTRSAQGPKRNVSTQ
jgi:hypothetical protein